MPTKDNSTLTDRGLGRTQFLSPVVSPILFLALLVALVGSLVALNIRVSLAERDETRLLSTSMDHANELDSVEPMSYEQVTNLVASLPTKTTAQDIADVLIQLDGWSFPDQELEQIEKIEIDLAARLRDKVKTEVTALHKLALESANYSTGYERLREAGTTLTLFPLTDDPGILKEAEILSANQTSIARRLELIRRQRYNHWAAGQVEVALKILRIGAKNQYTTDAAVQTLCTIDPPLLEPAVASIYSYAIEEITDNLKGEKKATIAKQLTETTTYRKTLEDF